MVSRSVKSLYSVIIFLGSFLLFFVEPMAAKRLLPALGGSSAVWITCLAFFQVVLLFGYLYAHLLGRSHSVQLARRMHVALLLLGVALLIFVPQPDLSNVSTHPVTAIFGTLALTIGLPFLLLASTSPLLQRWLLSESGGKAPWRLFALSNAGSLLALGLYPSLIEPYISLPRQQVIFLLGFALYAVLCGVLALRMPRAGFVSADNPHLADEAPRSSTWRKLLWFLLPAGAAMQLSAVTSHLSQNVAAVPLLWIVPLAVYLLTFILTFEMPRAYQRWFVMRLLIVMLASLGYMLSKIDMGMPIRVSIGFFLLELLLACLFCHGEVYRLRPAHPSEVTLFYLLLAAGGAAGTLFIGIGCPLLFDANYDVALAFLATAALALAVSWNAGWAQRLLWSTGTLLLIVLVGMLHVAYARSAVVQVRNFYGALRVRQSYLPPQAHISRTLFNGTIEHGMQWFAPLFRRTPTTYYATNSGVGLALRFCCGELPRRIGVIGLGAGTIAAYGRSGDQLRFYEINSAVRPIAENLFSYLKESPAKLSFAEGDARVSLTHEQPQHFDVLAIDAFSGDAIPVHLLTTQAMQLYLRHLQPNGVLAFHVSNRYLDLTPEVAELAQTVGMQARVVDSPTNDLTGEYAATWVLVTKNDKFLQLPQIAASSSSIPQKRGVFAWTDDHSSLLPILR